MTMFSMTCSCGDVMTVEAENRDEAMAKMKEMWTQEVIDKHMAEKHPGEPALTLAQAHTQIEQKLQAA